MIDYTIITEPVKALTIGNSLNINLVMTILVSLSCVIITRNMHRLKLLHLPMGVAWASVGATPGIIPLCIYLVIAISSIFSLSQIGDVITGMTERLKQGVSTTDERTIKKLQKEERQRVTKELALAPLRVQGNQAIAALRRTSAANITEQFGTLQTDGTYKKPTSAQIIAQVKKNNTMSAQSILEKSNIQKKAIQQQRERIEELIRGKSKKFGFGTNISLPSPKGLFTKQGPRQTPSIVSYTLNDIKNAVLPQNNAGKYQEELNRIARGDFIGRKRKRK